MHKLSAGIFAGGLGLLVSACGGAAGPDRDGITRGPAPYAALTSGDEALKVVFDVVCLPTVLDGADFVTLAKSHYLVEGKPQADPTGQTNQSFVLASMAHATATRFSDGTCMIGIERGEPAAYRDHILNLLAAKGQMMRKGQIDKARTGGDRVVYCNTDPRPLMLILNTPDGPKSKRPAIVASLYRAKGGASDICLR